MHGNHPQEFKEAIKGKTVDTGITLIPNESNLFVWRALLQVRELAGADLIAQVVWASGWTTAVCCHVIAGSKGNGV